MSNRDIIDYLGPERRRRAAHRWFCTYMGMPALTAKDKLSLEGLGIILSIIMAVSGATVWMETRYSKQSDVVGLRCDIYMLYLARLEARESITRMDQQIYNRISRQWNQFCSGANLKIRDLKDFGG